MRAPFLLLLIASACGGPAEDPATPAGKGLPPDQTEVKIEKVDPNAVPATLNSATTTTSSPTSASSTTAATPTTSAPPTTGTVDEDGGPQDAELEKSVGPVRPRLRACFKKARETDASVGGIATFDATIGKDGKVASARFVKRDGLNDDMVGCLLAAVKTMTFDPSKKSQIVALSFGQKK